jgi:hypothetical protein
MPAAVATTYSQPAPFLRRSWQRGSPDQRTALLTASAIGRLLQGLSTSKPSSRPHCGTRALPRHSREWGGSARDIPAIGYNKQCVCSTSFEPIAPPPLPARKSKRTKTPQPGRKSSSYRTALRRFETPTDAPSSSRSKGQAPTAAGEGACCTGGGWGGGQASGTETSEEKKVRRCRIVLVSLPSAQPNPLPMR